jgi:hypothetical protein
LTLELALKFDLEFQWVQLGPATALCLFHLSKMNSRTHS